ncbi:IS1-like element transposase [Streptomyces sp. S1]|uniref:IS1-like element transposase n=1 Tax=Streptomyces sp. S1 TaxID=718288 RepID=UPI0013CF1999
MEYINNASKPGVKERIVEMSINGSGVRDTVRVLKVGINTVIRVLKKSSIKKQ